jgi:HD-GYP domain-containing protein (c-di-GMP phosphodiesterase class II)
VGQAHSECEAELLAELPELATVWDLVKLRTENFDGTGFPEGREAERIPVASRILRVADEYDLLIQPKHASSSLRHDEAMRFLSQRSGKQFDPQVIEILSQFSPGDLPQVTSTPTDHSDQDTTGNRGAALVDASFA